MAHFLQETIAVLGCGHMGRAMVQGWLRAEALAPASIIATTKSAASAQKLRDELGIRATDGGNAEAATQASVIIVAVKPWLVAEVLDELELVVGPKQLLVSVAASIPASFLQARLHRKEVSIARAMPNLPVAFGQGVVGIAMGASPAEATARQALRERLEKLFAPLGQTVVLEDAQMDALTALAGSGPAYIYMVIEAMAMAGVKLGLPVAVASRAATQTVLGAAWHVKESGAHPAVLRDQVTTPGGTTIAALHELEKAGLTAAFMNAMDAAAAQAKTRGEQILRNLKA